MRSLPAASPKTPGPSVCSSVAPLKTATPLSWTSSVQPVELSSLDVNGPVAGPLSMRSLPAASLETPGPSVCPSAVVSKTSAPLTGSIIRSVEMGVEPSSLDVNGPAAGPLSMRSLPAASPRFAPSSVDDSSSSSFSPAGLNQSALDG
eukprot:TRINITY_DN222_c0_g1_i8.p2 TRINITY_DN222_c0_g1~~TRINITY_DN222_c0_g1_i8.p2  ORF type:complete len:148 (-),score=2.60 TRINITY_DN222_c0_g1_i8:51-494(-)